MLHGILAYFASKKVFFNLKANKLMSSIPTRLTEGSRLFGIFF